MTESQVAMSSLVIFTVSAIFSILVAADIFGFDFIAVVLLPLDILHPVVAVVPHIHHSF